MVEITHADASANILRFCAEKRLTQGQWHEKGKDGRDIACLLGSIDPSVKMLEDCNGDLMPLWLARITVVLFDHLSVDNIYPIALRYGELVARWHILTDTDWNSILIKFLVRCIDDAVEAARPVSVGKPYWDAIETVCEQSKVAIKSGDKTAADAADAAARAVADASVGPAASAAASAAACAAAYAAAAAIYADAAAGAPGAAIYAAGARVAVYDKLFTFVLDQIEGAIH